jgi:hypothetical protein
MSPRSGAAVVALSLAVILASDCGGSTTSDKDPAGVSTAKAPASATAARFTADEQAQVQRVFQQLQWDQSGFASVLVTCSVLAEAKDTGAKGCFQEGGKFTNADEEWRRSVEMVVSTTAAAAQDSSIGCRKATVMLQKRMVAYAKTVTDAQIAGAEGHKARFIKLAGHVVGETPLTGAAFEDFQRQCSARNEAAIPTDVPMPKKQFLGFRTETHFIIVDAESRCPISADGSCDGWHSTAQCIKAAIDITGIVRCSANSEAASALRRGDKLQAFNDCIDKIGTPKQEPHECAVP